MGACCGYMIGIQDGITKTNDVLFLQVRTMLDHVSGQVSPASDGGSANLAGHGSTLWDRESVIDLRTVTNNLQKH